MMVTIAFSGAIARRHRFCTTDSFRIVMVRRGNRT
jgi:hypothetical protein